MDLRYRPLTADDVLDLDDSFTTDAVLEVTTGPLGCALAEVPVVPPLTKVFPPDEDDPPPVEGFVAVDPAVRGFVQVEFAEWHARLVIRQLTVDPGYRGRGVGRALMELAVGWGRARGARTAWLETSNVNVPAVRAYRRMGFALCGLDTTLYRGTVSEGEVALFLAREL
ncbi:GNAT family N-acetyltransferase [Actinosynnema sp. NPDC023587]|uniref:GNAT family N-acetyltransferase n=1 Tax=Actinosynnema sp. NPDC023587 TaxID=3154695 RepID=UPI0033F0DA29